jgi:predicted AAA+ superfamily ATPase
MEPNIDRSFDEVIRDKLAEVEVVLKQPRVTRYVSLPQLRGKALTVVGMRRVGKTQFLHQLQMERLAKGVPRAQLAYVNFEDERLAGFGNRHLGQLPEVIARLEPTTARASLTLFLDAVQLVQGWETAVRRLMDNGIEVVLSGSSAKLLSGEIATSMRGRGWEVSLYPFSFDEFARFHELPIAERKSARARAAVDRYFADYLRVGGFPEAQTLKREHQIQLVQGYVDAVMLRDIVERHEIAHPSALRWMIRRLLSAPGGLFSITSFAKDIKSQGIRVGRELLYSYLDHLEDAFLVHTIPVATDSEKRRQVNPRKVYPADTSLIPAFDRSRKPNRGQALETCVFTELKRRRADVAYVRTQQGHEVDFLARFPDGDDALIQVCESIDAEDVRTREVRALVEAAAEYPGAARLILTREARTPFPAVAKGIRTLPAWQWMLEE